MFVTKKINYNNSPDSKHCCGYQTTALVVVVAQLLSQHHAPSLLFCGKLKYSPQLPCLLALEGKKRFLHAARRVQSKMAFPKKKTFS